MENWLSSDPDIRAAFFWINSLSPVEKRLFATLTKPGGNGKLNFWKLYEGMTRMKEYDEGAIRSLVPKRNFTRDLETLLEKLIYWQAFNDKKEGPRLYVIQKALEVGAMGMVRKILAEDIENCMATGRYSRLLMIHEWMDKMHYIFGLKYSAYLPKLPFRQSIMERLQEQGEWHRAIRGFRSAFMSNEPNRSTWIKINLGGLYQLEKVRYKPKSSFKLPDLQLRIDKGRIATRMAMLRGNLERSIAHQQNVLDLVMSANHLSVAEKLHESNIQVHLNAMSGNFVEAEKILENMYLAKVENPMEANLRFRFVAFAEMGLAERRWDVEGAARVEQGLKERPEAFLPGSLGILWHRIALIQFVSGAFRASIRSLQEFFALPSTEKEGFLVWAELLELGALYSLGEWEDVDRIMRRVGKVVQASGSKFADLIFRTLHSLGRTSAFGKESEIVAPFLQEFDALLSEWDYPDELWYFDLGHWWESHRRGMSCKALQDLSEEDWRWRGHMDEVDPAWSICPVYYPNIVKKDPDWNLRWVDHSTPLEEWYELFDPDPE